MTNKEQETIDKLYKIVSDLKADTTRLIEEMNKKVERNQKPITLESDILSTVQTAIQKAIHESLTKYDSPLIKLVTLVISDKQTELRRIISETFDEVIKKDEFKQAIRDGFSHKVARSLISTNDALFEKVANDLKQDTVFKSKMALAVANVVNECLEERKSK